MEYMEHMEVLVRVPAFQTLTEVIARIHVR